MVCHRGCDEGGPGYSSSCCCYRILWSPGIAPSEWRWRTRRVGGCSMRKAAEVRGSASCQISAWERMLLKFWKSVVLCHMLILLELEWHRHQHCPFIPFCLFMLLGQRDKENCFCKSSEEKRSVSLSCTSDFRWGFVSQAWAWTNSNLKPNYRVCINSLGLAGSFPCLLTFQQGPI